MLLEEMNLLEAVLATRRSPATRTAYRSDLKDFCRFLGAEPPTETLGRFVTLPQRSIQIQIEGYKEALTARGAMPATVNRRLSAIRAVLEYAADKGCASSDGRAAVSNKRILVSSPFEGLTAMKVRCLLALPDLSTERGLRDAVVLRLLCENALRPHEICSAMVGSYSSGDRTLTLMAGAPDSRKVVLSTRCSSLLGEYLQRSGHGFAADHPLLKSLDHRYASRVVGLTGKGLRHLLSGYGQQINAEITPRQLRRSVIALAAHVTGQDASHIQLVLDTSADGHDAPLNLKTPRTQRDVTRVLSDLVSDPRLIREDAERLRQRSRSLRDQSASATARSEWLHRKISDLQRRMEEQAARWAKFGRDV